MAAQDIASKTLSKKKTETQEAKAVALKSPAPFTQMKVTNARQIAESDLSIGNWKFRDADQAFPNEPQLRTVEKYFPYAKGGPLLVDIPETEGDRLTCERKAQVLRKLGYRYLILTRDLTLLDAHGQLGAH